MASLQHYKNINIKLFEVLPVCLHFLFIKSFRFSNKFNLCVENDKSSTTAKQIEKFSTSIQNSTARRANKKNNQHRIVEILRLYVL